MFVCPLPRLLQSNHICVYDRGRSTVILAPKIVVIFSEIFDLHWLVHVRAYIHVMCLSQILAPIPMFTTHTDIEYVIVNTTLSTTSGCPHTSCIYVVVLVYHWPYVSQSSDGRNMDGIHRTRVWIWPLASINEEIFQCMFLSSVTREHAIGQCSTSRKRDWPMAGWSKTRRTIGTTEGEQYGRVIYYRAIIRGSKHEWDGMEDA